MPFKSLDKDHDGRLDLEDLSPVLGGGDPCSDHGPHIFLPSLYLFDTTHDGRLSVKEYARLDKFVESLRQSINKHRRHHLQTVVASKPARSSSGNALDRTEPATGTATAGVEASEERSNGHAEETLYGADYQIRFLERQALPLLFAQGRMRSPDQTRFLDWLFRLSDVHGANRVGAEELRVLVSAMQRDGVDISRLNFEGRRDLQDILREYDQHRQGYLTRDDFMVLGDLVLGEYSRMLKRTKQPSVDAATAARLTGSDLRLDELEGSENDGGGGCGGDDAADGNRTLSAARFGFNAFRRPSVAATASGKIDSPPQTDGSTAAAPTAAAASSTGAAILGERAVANVPVGADTVDSPVLGRVLLSHELGRGSYGVARHGKRIGSAPAGAAPGLPDEVAVKVMTAGNCSDLTKVEFEIEAMKSLSHPNIVQLFDVVVSGSSIYLFLELCGGGSLTEEWTMQSQTRQMTGAGGSGSGTRMPEPVAKYFFVQLMAGLEYCHFHMVCHRDLRLENLLLDNAGHLKISDFGQARIFRKGWDVFSSDLVGSLYHLAPEQVKGKAYAGRSVDIWSAGVILYALLCGRMPFWAGSVPRLFDQIMKGEYEPLPTSGMSADAQDLLRRMLVVDPAQRITVAAILEHPFCRRGEQVAPSLLEYEIDAVGLDCALLQSPNNMVCCKVAPMLAEQGVHAHRDNAADRHDTWKCFYPPEHLRFSMVVRTDVGGGSCRLQFRMHDGEARSLRRIVARLNEVLSEDLQMSKTPTAVSEGSSATAVFGQATATGSTSLGVARASGDASAGLTLAADAANSASATALEDRTGTDTNKSVSLTAAAATNNSGGGDLGSSDRRHRRYCSVQRTYSQIPPQCAYDMGTVRQA